MKLLPYITGFFLLSALYLAASCEAQQQSQSSSCDTLSITSGKANKIVISSTQSFFMTSVIVIEDKNGKILAFKSKDGWQIDNAEAALEVLIADLELCKQSK